MALSWPKAGWWTRLSRGWRIGVVVLAVLLVLALTLWIVSILLRPAYPTQAEITKEMKAQAALTGGEKIYVAHCAYCHDKGIGPSIAGRNLPPEAIASFVRMGPGAMQAFPSSQISDADIAAVAGYVNGLPLAKPQEDGK